MMALVVLGCTALAVVTGLMVYVLLGTYWDEYRLSKGGDDEH